MQRVALALSLLLHLLVLVAWRPIGRLTAVTATEERAEESPPLVFELVETPENALRERPEEARFLSDKDAVARDERDAPESGDMPYIEGETDHNVFAGSPGGAPSPPAEGPADGREAPAEQADPGEGFEPAEARPTPGEAPIEPTTDRDYLVQAHREFLAEHGRFIDDVNLDQRVIGADELGDVSLNTYAWDWAEYILEMKRRIRENVHPPGAFTYLGLISGDTVLRFKVLPDGGVADLEVVGFTGHRSLMETSVTAVERAGPFRPLPADFPEEYLELMWTFSYVVRR